MRALLTGGSGFVGFHLTHRLLLEGHAVRHLASGPAGCPGVDRIIVDLADLSTLSRAVEEFRPDVIYHLACTPFNPTGTPAEEHLRVNALGTLSLLEAARHTPRARFIYTGSAAEYGSGSGLQEYTPLRPATLLGAAKACASTLVETYARLYGTEAVILRLFTPYGPGDHRSRLIPHVISSALEGRPVRLTSGHQQRDFFYITDLIEAMIIAATAPLAFPTAINLCSGTGRSVLEVARTVLRLMNSTVPIEIGALPTRPDEILECSGDNARAHHWLGWQPKTSLEQGLSSTIRWYQENPEWSKH